VRLEILESGHREPERTQLAEARAQGIVVSDVRKLLAYRPELFGRPFSELLQPLMRGPSSFWSVGERELFAAFVSARSQCPF
jgi:hypothetical protein